jgi:hypothetical protein
MPRATETIEPTVTRRFYSRFRSECEAFADLIEGISGEEAKQQYASTLLVRLMFVYFVRSKGQSGDMDYLRSKLAESGGGDRFYSGLLRPLPAGKKRGGSSGGVNARGRIAGLFSLHEIEASRGESIRIPGAAFEKVLAFFDQYRWRLEEGEHCGGREITPDMLGSILEQHINQKQMGAYYTRGDITEYVAKNTVIPSLFDSAGRQLSGEPAVWRLLQADPDRYIYPAVRKGAELSLPSEIAAGSRDDSSRACPDQVALRRYCLPAETWREMLARRRRLEETRAKLSNGEVRSIDDLVTYNLDIRRFARDVLETCESPRALGCFWRALESVAILDPTCGSGAFLFAALNILEPLYEACLDRMESFLGEPEVCDAESLTLFRGVFERVGPSDRRRFISKAIISNNLFGVDIMEEAVEICRLRFFLKLLARSGDGQSIESLGQTRVNIRAGNALVGYAREGPAGARSKRDLDSRLSIESGVDPRDVNEYGRWLADRKPLHWCAEFPEVINRGGFDAVVGNPPYMSAAKAREQYGIKNYVTASCPDVYAWVLERACALLRPGGRSGSVVPLSLTFSRDFDACRKLIFENYGENWFSSFARIPSALFNFDVRVRNTIHIGHKSGEQSRQHTTRTHRWFEAARPHLFELIQYAPFAPALWQNKIPKLNTRGLSESFERCIRRSRSTVAASLVRGPTPYALCFKRSAYNWLSFCRRLPPCYDRHGERVTQTKVSTVYFADARARDLAFLLLNGKIMLAFWAIVGDDFDLTRWMFADFPMDLSEVSGGAASRLLGLADELEKLMDENIVFKLNAGKRVGNYNLARCREVTDRSDRVFAARMGIEDAWPDIELFYAQVVLTGFDGREA